MLPLLVLLGMSSPAHADPQATRDALERLEEVLELRLDDGRLDLEQLSPAILVSAQPRYEQTAPWFGTRVIEVLQGALGEGSLRLCQACMAPRARAESGALVYRSFLDALRSQLDGAGGRS